MPSIASKVSICSKALLRVGESPIQSYTEQSTEAAYCRQFYDDARRATLRAHPWNFAIKIAALAELADETSYRYDYVFQLPSDCINVIDLQPDSSDDQAYAPDTAKIEYEIVGDKIHTNEEDAYIRYVYDLEDTTKFDDLFVDAFSYRLAADLAMPITRDAGYVDSMYRLFRGTLSEAKASNSNEDHRVPEMGMSFINARN